MKIEDFLILTPGINSKSEARRLVKSGAISINKEKIDPRVKHIYLYDDGTHIIKYKCCNYDVAELLKEIENE
jgi:hypothetical protein